MKSIFKICIVLLVLSGNVYSQNKFGSETDSEIGMNSPSNSQLSLISFPEQKIQNNSFNIYPSHASRMITISCAPGIESACTLQIKNTLGELVYTDPMKMISGNFIKEVDLSCEPKGIYFVEIASNDERKVEKVIFP